LSLAGTGDPGSFGVPRAPHSIAQPAIASIPLPCV
jgi:hypothetical protein